jgi:hypothetical protein
VVLSKRERYVVIGTTLAIGLFVLDKMILGPVFDYRKQITTAVEDAQKKLEDNKRMFIMQGRSEKLWNQMVTTGGLKADQPTADQQLQVKMHDWIVESGLEEVQTKPEKVTEIGGFKTSAHQWTVAGRTRALAQLLWRLETSPIPVKVTGVDVKPKHEGIDDLTVQINVSTLFLNPDGDKTKGGAPRAPITGTRS